MKLYLLTRKGRTDYDEYDAQIIRASSPKAARKLAALGAGAEGASVWLKSSGSMCQTLKEKGPQKVILGSFNAG
jgi:hypothetical protein